MQRSYARQLFVLLLLLALVASGGRFDAMAMTVDMNGTEMSDQQPDQGCNACGGAMTPAPCDVACAALPVIGVAALELSDIVAHERWLIRAESKATLSVKPDTSPPRA